MARMILARPVAEAARNEEIPMKPFRSIQCVAGVALALSFLVGAAGSATAAPENNLVASAISKLDAEELYALLSTPMAVAEAAIDREQTSDGPSIQHALQTFQWVMQILRGPLRFIAADGTEFDCYGEYVAYQWGGVGLPCE